MERRASEDCTYIGLELEENPGWRASGSQLGTSKTRGRCEDREASMDAAQRGADCRFAKKFCGDRLQSAACAAPLWIDDAWQVTQSDARGEKALLRLCLLQDLAARLQAPLHARLKCMRRLWLRMRRDDHRRRAGIFSFTAIPRRRRPCTRPKV